MKHAQYYRNIANGIARINQCIFACRLPMVETGTLYSKRFKKAPLFSMDSPIGVIDIHGIDFITKENMQKDEPLPEFNSHQEYTFSFKLDNLDQDTIDSLKELSKPDEFIHGIDDCGSLFSAN